MQEDILINVHPFETRVAVSRGGVLHELHLQRAAAASVAGNLYRGKVVRILPGMQAAFVEIGLDRPGFLHARDIHRSFLQTAPPTGDSAGTPDISQLLHDGQTLLVQVMKDPLGSKGARLSTQPSLPSRHLVLMPDNDHIGVSQRIEDPEERERLKTAVAAAQAAEGFATQVGFIVRTAAEGAAALEIAEDMRFLRRVWQQVRSRAADAAVPALVYEDLPMHIRVLRDLVGNNLQQVLVDDAATCTRIRNFAAQFLPEYAQAVQLYSDPLPLFERHGIEEELARALDIRVPLKSGGHLVIEQTEAMTTVDVNTGGYVGRHNLEDTVYRTNLEAAAMVPRQLQLRNLGGIIIIDFIDMTDPEHQRQVLRALEKGCEQDRARVRIYGLSQLGLVEMSRKRTRDSLARQLCEPCAACQGTGRTRTAASVCSDLFRALLRDAARHSGVAAEPPGGEVLVRAAPAVVDRLLDEDAATVAAISGELGLPLRMQVEPMYPVEQFDIVLVQDVRRQGGN